MQRIGQCAIPFEARKGVNDAAHCITPPCSQQPASSNKCIAPPVEEPRIARDDRLPLATFNDELLEGILESVTEYVTFIFPRGRLRIFYSQGLGCTFHRQHSPAIWRQGNLKPSGTTRIAEGRLAAICFNRMRHFSVPFHFVMKRAVTDFNLQLATPFRCKAESFFIMRNIFPKKVFISFIEMRFGVKTAILNIHTHG